MLIYPNRPTHIIDKYFQLVFVFSPTSWQQCQTLPRIHVMLGYLVHREH